MNTQIFGVFSTADAAEHAIAALKDHGVATEDISVLHSADGSGAPDVEGVADHALTSTSSGDVVAGALKGGSAGLLLGVIGGALAITIPGIGPVLAAGPLWGAISAALATTAAGAVSGGTVGFLVDQGVAEETATRYHDAVAQGGILVSVHSAHITDTDATVLLEKYGATQVEGHAAGIREVPPYETSATGYVPETISNPTPGTIIGEATNWPEPPRPVGHPVGFPVDEEPEELEPVGTGAGV